MEKEKITEYVRKLITVHGLCMLPLKDGEKHTGGLWKQYQNRLPNDMEIANWADKKRWCIVCGKVSGNLEAIDFDEKVRKGIFEEWKSLLPPEALELLKTLPLTQTINKGFHVLYRCSKIEGNTVLAKGLDKKGLIETRGEGGLVVEPPTDGYIHINGSLEHIPEITPEQRRVFWDTARALNEIVEEHKVIAKKSQPNDGARPGDDYNTRATWEEILLPLGWTLVGQQREKKFWKRSGKTENGISATENYAGNGLLHVFSTSTPLEPGKSYPKFSAYAILHHNGDFASAARELAKKGYGKAQKEEGANTPRKNDAQSDKIVWLITEDPATHIILFHNQFKEPFLRLTVEAHQEIWPCRSKMCRRWLSHHFWKAYRKALGAEALNSALNVLEGKACFDGKMMPLANRITECDDAIWYDLSDKEWRAVRITREEWSVIKNPPILFRHYAHQKSQYEPMRDGDARLLLKHLNIAEEKQRLLFLVWVISCFVPAIPHPILIVYGAQGSAKSSLCRLLKMIIDPSEMDTSGFPREEKEFIQLLAHHWCLVFDNVSHISGYASDIICKAVTGSGLSKRELYTDDDDIIYNLRRSIILNGINQVATRPDILERSILLELERVPKEKRKSEKMLLMEFEKDLPQILGGIFTVLQRAMKIEPTVELSSMPRMADFTRWGCAIAEALGHTHGQFLDAYYQNICGQNEEVLSESLAATAVLNFMEDKDEWSGTPSSLLKELTATAEALEINTSKEGSFPKSAQILSRRLNELKTNLAEAGIKFERGKGKNRRLDLSKTSVSIVAPSTSTEMSPQITDDITNDGHNKPSGLSSPKNDAEQTPKDRGDDRDAGNDAGMNLETF